MVDEEKKFYTIPEVAVVLGIDYLKARRLVKQKIIKSIDLTTSKDSQSKIFVTKEYLVNYINKTIKVKK